MEIQCNQMASNACPCALSALNNCVMCSHLKGENFCNCNWNGHCVFLEYKFQQPKVTPPSQHNQIKKASFATLANQPNTHIVYFLVPKRTLNSLDPTKPISIQPQNNDLVVFNIAPKNYSKDNGILSILLSLQDQREKQALAENKYFYVKEKKPKEIDL
ncbi:hypothetical protein GGQ84_001774 [Desulfitispora alkaliphila]|uniref:hypothetical protein n=1 Tax=Desulfitispora alkaliphila TaxID=622674 RepID=UPI003D1DD3CE